MRILKNSDEPRTVSLRNILRDVVAKIRRYQDRGMGEKNTKASLIEPVLEALGWDVRDPDEVFREFKAKSVDQKGKNMQRRFNSRRSWCSWWLTIPGGGGPSRDRSRALSAQ